MKEPNYRTNIDFESFKNIYRLITTHKKSISVFQHSFPFHGTRYQAQLFCMQGSEPYSQLSKVFCGVETPKQFLGDPTSNLAKGPMMQCCLSAAVLGILKCMGHI